ncbi:ABC transporter ATP-binding protein [Streptomyces sp. NPDC087228]|uniref:ABC transporter ATP-binding protein n=1 Tax=Streptomyces sp. NPDC087228 TaxID=3365772 RepID=UPI003826FC8D
MRECRQGKESPLQPNGNLLRRGITVLFTSIRSEPRVFTAAAIASGIYALLTVATARVLGQVTDDVVIPALRKGSVPGPQLAEACFTLAAIAVVSTLAFLVRRLLGGQLQFRLQATYRRRVARRYIDAPYPWLQRRPVGEMLAVANSDVEAAWLPVARLPLLFSVVVLLVASTADMVLTDLALAGVGVLLFPAILWLNRTYQNLSAQHAITSQQYRGEVSAIAHESFDGSLAVKVLRMEDREAERFREAVHRLRRSNIAFGRARSFFEPALELLPSLAVLGVILVGAARIQSGHIAAGDVVHVAYLVTVITFPLRIIGNVFKDLPRSVAGFDRVQEVLAHEFSPEPDRNIPDHAKDMNSETLELDSVSFAYPGSRSRAVDRLGLTVASGEVVALVGPTGSGKSTVAHLVAGLMDPTGGAVRWRGADLRSLPREEACGRISLAAQQSFLFDDTVRANIALRGEEDDELVRQALRAADAEDFVRALSGGLDASVGERGGRLSGGQRQRLSLARALLRKPELLILDDATSAVDAETEARILRKLQESGLASAILVVSSRRSAIDIADRVAYMENGRILDQGSPLELYQRCSPYRTLIDSYAVSKSPGSQQQNTHTAGDL